jgi:hypothetical protein
MTPLVRCCVVVAVVALVAMFILPYPWWLAAWVIAIVATAIGAIALQETGR